MLDKIPPEVREIAPGAIGSAVALRWIEGPWYWKLASFATGSYAAWLTAAPLVALLELGDPRWIGVFGLMIGAVAISFVGKLVDTVNAIQPAVIWQAIVEAIRKRLGVNGKSGE